MSNVTKFPTREEMAEEEKRVDLFIADARKVMVEAEFAIFLHEISRHKLLDHEIASTLLKALRDTLVHGGLDKEKAKMFLLSRVALLK